LSISTPQLPEPVVDQVPNRPAPASAARRAVRLAYLINQYPQPSQSFIRREIAALERLGLEVERFTVRPARETELVDEADRAERSRTRSILDVGSAAMGLVIVATVLTHPLRFLHALKLALQVGWRSDRGPLIHLVYLAEACVLRRWLAQQKIRHVHAHFGTNSTTVAMLCHELGGPAYSFTAHGPEEFDRATSIALGEKVARAKFVVSISEFGRSQLYRWCEHRHWSKIHVVRCGLDDVFLNYSAPAAKGARLVCVGRLSEQKGQLLLIEAAAQLARDGTNFELVLIGDGPMREAIQQLIDRHELNGRVTIAGWMSNAQVRQQMIEARAVVLPSFAEGLPVVLMEALAMRRPVISTFVAGIPELVESGENGWLVPAGDIEALVDAMKRALEATPAELARMGDAGAEKARRLHNANVEAGKLAELLSDI
jgi:colanic acid/amylovoran biosynthesis glycosyltransferase